MRISKLLSGKLMAAFLSATLLAGFSSCGNSSKKELNKLLLECADNDKTVDASDWSKIQTFINDNKRNLRQFYSDDKIDEAKVKEYITDFFTNRRPSKQISFYGMTGDAFMKVKFYLERSGSTFGYDAPQTKGDFKAAIVQLLNNIPGDNAAYENYVVNDSIYPYPGTFKDFISDPNIFQTTKNIGNAKYTDFNSIFSSILDETKSNELGILVTDLIYSTKEMQQISAQKIFNEETGMANVAFGKHTGDKAVLVLQMMGDFSGPYYPYNAAKNTQYKGQRPYYFIIIGNNDDIRRISTDETYKNFVSFNDLGGFQHRCLFAKTEMYEPYFTIALDNASNKGKFRVDRDSRGKGGTVKAITKIEADPNSGSFQFSVAVDLKSVLADKEYVEDVKNYEVKGGDPFTVVEVKEITAADIKPSNKDALSHATHFITLATDKFTHKQTLSVKLLNRLPAWVEAASSDDDTNTKSADFSKTTFGLKYFMKGVYDAYRNKSTEEPCYFDLNIELNK